MLIGVILLSSKPVQSLSGGEIGWTFFFVFNIIFNKSTSHTSQPLDFSLYEKSIFNFVIRDIDKIKIISVY